MPHNALGCPRRLGGRALRRGRMVVTLLLRITAHCPDANVVLLSVAFIRRGAALLAEFRVMLGPVRFFVGCSTFFANRCIELDPVLRLDRFPATFCLWCPWLRSCLLACHRCSSLLLVVIVAYQGKVSTMAQNRATLPVDGSKHDEWHNARAKKSRARGVQFRARLHGDDSARKRRPCRGR